jgi:reactive intermediate/imine deaminase
MKTIISTPFAPSAIGPYSQAVRVGNTVYLSGQIPLDPATMHLVDGIDAQISRVFDNLTAVCIASGGTLNDIVKLTVFMIDLGHFGKVNDIMMTYFATPSRAARKWRWKPLWYCRKPNQGAAVRHFKASPSQLN